MRGAREVIKQKLQNPIEPGKLVMTGVLEQGCFWCGWAALIIRISQVVIVIDVIVKRTSVTLFFLFA